MMAIVVTAEAGLVFVTAIVMLLMRARVGARMASIAQQLRWPMLPVSVAERIVAVMSVVLMLLAVTIMVAAWTVFEYST